MSHCELVLEALRDGEWHTTADLYRATGGFLILHSRISDLRKRGHNIQGRNVPGQSGADGYEYRLATSVVFIDVPSIRTVDAPAPVPAVGQLVIGDL